MTSVTQRFILGPVLFSILIGDMGRVIGCTLRKFMDNIKLHGGVYTTEKMDVIGKDLNDLKRGGSMQTL